MHNRTTAYTSYLLIVILISSIYPGESRFRLIIKRYNNYENVYEKRGINVDVDAVSDSRKRYYYPSLDETLLFDMTTITNTLGLHSIKNYETPLTDKGRMLNTSLNLRRSDQEYIQRSPLLYLDTTEYSFEINTQYRYHTALYFLQNTKKIIPFIQLTTTFNGDFYHYKKTAYDKDLAAVNNDTLKFDWITRRKQNATFVLDMFGFLGAGRHTNMTPVYQSLMIEKRLIKNGIAHFILSGNTLCSLAKLLSRNNTYALKKYENAREFKLKVDSVIVQDSAVEKQKLRYISSIELQEIVLCNTPLFLAKPRCRIFSASRLFTDVYRMDDQYPYTDILQDTASLEYKVKYEHLLGIDFQWGIPCTKYWFLSMYALRNILSTDKKIYPLDWDKALDIQLSIQSTWWISQWFICEAGMKYLPAWIVAPRAAPYQSYCNFNLFIEDNVKLKAEASYKKLNEIHKSYLHWFEPITRIDEGIIVSISASYAF